ncbi:hypothetical protein B0H19DRAFT_1243251 [Mycena capillaripes]|nr:hypothetical protein B0H19DRAFT_1243251 [Mycena capillaripes]
MADYEIPDDEEFVAEVPRVISKKAASIKTFESKDMEMAEATSLFDSDQASFELDKVPAHRKGKHRKMQSDSGDEFPDAPPRRSIPDDDVAMHEAIADALVSIPLDCRSRRSSTASWSSGQDLRVPDSDADDDDDAPAPPPANKASFFLSSFEFLSIITGFQKPRKVSAARQQQADLERPQVRPAPVPNTTRQVMSRISTTSLRETNTTTLRDEAKWHPSAQIIYPAPGKKDILLNSQTEELQRVLRSSMALVKTALLFENSYPAIISRAGFARAYLVSAAEALPEAKHILERLGLDLKYAAILADILLDRINILRGDIKRTAASVAPGYFQFAGLNEAKTKELIEKLLKDHRYIFPVDSQTQRLITEKPFHHPALKAIIKDSVFNRNFKANSMHLFISTSKKHPTQLELPDAMVALAATALYAALLEYRTTGERQVIAFTEGAYEDTYRNHMKTLSDTRDAAPVALHKVLHALFNDVTDGKATVPEAGSSATLINLIESAAQFKSLCAFWIKKLTRLTQLIWPDYQEILGNPTLLGKEVFPDAGVYQSDSTFNALPPSSQARLVIPNFVLLRTRAASTLRHLNLRRPNLGVPSSCTRTREGKGRRVSQVHEERQFLKVPIAFVFLPSNRRRVCFYCNWADDATARTHDAPQVRRPSARRRTGNAQRPSTSAALLTHAHGAALALVVRSLNRRLLMSDSPRVHPGHRIAGAPEICLAPSARASAVFTPVSVRENILVSNNDFTLASMEVRRESLDPGYFARGVT